MIDEELYTGAEGVDLRFEVIDPKSTNVLPGAPNGKIFAQSPSGLEKIFIASRDDDHNILYETLAGDLDVAGIWRFHAQYEDGTFKNVLGRMIRQEVKTKFQPDQVPIP